MNRQIKELALRAGLSHMPSNYPDMADLYKGADFELEKFALLIVKETLQVARAGIEYGNGMEDAVYKYFGVDL